MRPYPIPLNPFAATMPTFHNLSTFDLVIVSLLLVLCLRGFWLGCLRQVPVLLALVGGFVVLGRVAHLLLPWTSGLIASAKVSFLLGFALVSLVAWFILSRLIKLMGRSQPKHRVGVGNRFFGLILGGCTAFVLTSLVYLVLDSTLSTTNNLLRTSQTSPFLHQGSELLRTWILDADLRQSFQHKEPAIVPGSHPAKQEAMQAEAPPVKP